MLLAALVLGACALVGVPLRARLMLAAALIAVYVPLAGGGPSIQRAGVMGVAGLVAALAGRPARRWYALLLAAAVDARAQPAGGGRARVAAVVRGGRRAAGRRAAAAAARSQRRMPAPVAEAAAITIAATIGTAPLMALLLRAGLAGRAAREPAGRARDRADHVARRARGARRRRSPSRWRRRSRPSRRRCSSTSSGSRTTPRDAPLATVDVTAVAARDRRRLGSRSRSPRSRAAPLGVRGRARASRRALAGSALAARARRGARWCPARSSGGAPTPAPTRSSCRSSTSDRATRRCPARPHVGAGRHRLAGRPDPDAARRGRDRAARRAHAHPRGEPITRARRRPVIARVRAAARGRRRRRLAVAGPARALARTRIHAPAAGEVIALGGLRFEVLWPPPRAAELAGDRQPERPRAGRAARGRRALDAADRRRRERRARAAARSSRSTC